MYHRVVFRMNGVGNAFLREMGHVCPQCSADKPRANTSGSLFVYDGKGSKIQNHVLFDFGEGVVDSLLAFGVQRVDYLFNSHPHNDHIIGADRLLGSRYREPVDPASGRPIVVPLYCTSETWKHGLGWFYPWYERAGRVKWENLDGRLSTDVSPGGTPVGGSDFSPTGLNIGLQVTVVPVYHGNARGPVIFVVEFKAGDQQWKIILCWDLLHLVSDHSRPSSPSLNLPPGAYTLTGGGGTVLDVLNYDNPVQFASYVPQMKMGDFRPGTHGYPGDDVDINHPPAVLANRAAGLKADELLPEHEVLEEANELFLAGNTCKPKPDSGHMSIEAGFRLIRRVKPIRTWIVHYSGHEDPWGPLSDSQLQEWIDNNKKLHGCADFDIRVAQHGMMLAW